MSKRSNFLVWAIPAVAIGAVLVVVLMRKSSTPATATTATSSGATSSGSFPSSSPTSGLSQLSTVASSLQSQLTSVAQSVQAIQSGAPVTSPQTPPAGATPYTLYTPQSQTWTPAPSGKLMM